MEKSISKMSEEELKEFLEAIDRAVLSLQEKVKKDPVIEYLEMKFKMRNWILK